MSRSVLGLSVSAAVVRAVLVERRVIRWAGQARYMSVEDLGEVIARLAGESERAVPRARVVLERDVVQLRSLTPAPPLKGKVVPRWVSLEAKRLFRRNGVPLVTDGVIVPLGKETAALWAAAAPEPLIRAVLDGFAQAGLAVASLGPASEVLPRAFVSPSGAPLVIPNGDSAEAIDVGPSGAWRSRLVPTTDNREPATLVPALRTLGEPFAPAYAAAVAVPKLQLLPADTRAGREWVARRRLLRVLALAIGLWAVAGTMYAGRLGWTLSRSTHLLNLSRPAVDSVLALRRDLDAGTATLATIAAAQRGRSRQLAVLAAITRALDESTYVVALRIASDNVVRLVGYSPRAAKSLAQVENVVVLRDARFEGPVTRESRGVGSGEWDRFAIVARLERVP